MLVDNADIFDGSLVSIYNHIIASIETSGADARSAPRTVLRFDSSEIRTINSAVIKIFTT
jgi:hypothetical protein